MSTPNKNHRDSAKKGRHVDIFEEVTNQIVEELEKGVIPWKMPWSSSTNTCFPENALTGRHYSGINIIILWMATQKQGFSSSRWLTFRQALEAGGNMIKGERGTHATVFRPYDKSKKDQLGNIALDKNGQEIIEHSYHASKCTLFNVSQCENLSEGILLASELSPKPEFDCHAKAEQLIRASRVEVIHCHQNKACYLPSKDRIKLPEMGQFTTQGDYYSTVLHELVHATGHARRLARKGIVLPKKQKNISIYAFEELVAEIGSAFLCAELGIAGDLQHESYIEHWIKVLKEDKKAIFKAARFAREAFEYLLNQKQQLLAA